MWRAAVACALLAVLAAPSAADSNQTACETLHSYALLNSNLRAIGDRSVSVDGLEVSVSLYWGSGPARAAAALLRAQLTHVHRYRRVRLRRGPLSTAALAALVPFHSDANYTDLVIGLSTAWSPESAPPWVPSAGRKSSLAGPRLSEFGASPVPAHCRLFAVLAAAHRQPRCAGLSRHLTRADLAALAHCGFKHQINGSAFDLFVVDECNSTRLRACALDYGTTFSPKAMNRTDLYHKLNAITNNTESFFFLDFDIWEGEETVRALNVPCREQEVDMRIGDIAMLQTYAPQLFRFIYNFKPSATSLRQILEREANGDNIDEAACTWVIENEKYKIDKSTLMDYDASGYVVVIFVCNDDSFKDRYRYELFPFLGKHITNEMKQVTSYVTFRKYTINCTSEDDMSAHFEMLTTTVELYRLLGVVSMSVEGAQKASALAAPRHVPLMLADVAPEFGGNTTWRVAARVLHVASALTHFVRSSGWARLAVLTQPTKLAADYWDALRHNTTITFGHFQLPLRITRHKAKETIDSLRAANARIVFINADSKSAAVILAVADENGMTYHNGFVWIVRDWRPTTDTNTSCHEARRITHFVLSLWMRDSRDIPFREGNNVLQEHLSAKFKDRPWPPHAVSIANAFLTLTIGFKNVFKQNPSTRYDLHNKQVTRLLHNKITENPAPGVNQDLHFKNRSIEETAVFADQWCGAQFQQRLGRWRVNASSGAVRGNYTPPGDLPRHDGASRCMVSSGDAFDPACYDAACASALLLSLLACGALLLTRRVLLRRLERERHEQQIQAVARRQHVAAVLAAYLVERDALELREELGAGRFGSVRLARLRTSTHGTRYIAAKALRANAAPAEESEFLREACTIASLDHPHIVRLVGVCIADGPPLVLMELAFFGDLLGYLRARRHLVEGAGTEAPPASGEAEHVSAGALTRLAREAAEALRYLGARGVVHRDVRAANCLVDVRRSLKLADFGMARDTVAGADGAPEYACRRRGLFPVLWMAPESLAHGVFSAASDVWAFGVLLLELVTLGARPYGSMSPLCVLEYVAGGGSPPLPLDASPQMRGLARLCWQRAAERRPAAAELAAYLAAWPRALRPALLSERDEPADADSGIGDSPSTELLPPDSPLLSLDQLDVLGVTH
ncbi:uncharacterized protein LOC110382713 [Helicoverpa armigera]|uniref:uncharacterized protein LOC110382713 n=1 Tax=Helicoverpa armigera TaxID=29058 RepID=UPI0030837D54